MKSNKSEDEQFEEDVELTDRLTCEFTKNLAVETNGRAEIAYAVAMSTTTDLAAFFGRTLEQVISDVRTSYANSEAVALAVRARLDDENLMLVALTNSKDKPS